MRGFVVVAAAVLAVGCSSSEDPLEEAQSADLTACAPFSSASATGSPKVDRRAFDHLKSNLAARLGGANHRARDVLTTVGEPQWIVAKFAYGIADKDLEDERVDVFVHRRGKWEALGSARTGSDDKRAGLDGVEGVADGGGRVFFQIPAASALEIGRHRVRLVVNGDGTSVDVLVDVLPKNAPIVVSDVDGTLTSSENAEFPALLTGKLPDARPDAAGVLQALAKKGYRVMYVTARAERLGDRTRAFLSENGFPEGPIHTSTSALGLRGEAAATFKTEELKRLQARGIRIAWGFGNTDTDAQAYDAVAIEPRDHRVFLQLSDLHGGRRIEAYTDLLSTVATGPAVCR